MPIKEARRSLDFAIEPAVNLLVKASATYPSNKSLPRSMRSERRITTLWFAEAGLGLEAGRRPRAWEAAPRLEPGQRPQGEKLTQAVGADHGKGRCAMTCVWEAKRNALIGMMVRAEKLAGINSMLVASTTPIVQPTSACRSCSIWGRT